MFDSEFMENSLPEIQRVELDTMFLQLASLGVNNVLKFDFFESPPPQSVSMALENMVLMKAINMKDGFPTKRGLLMAQFPTDPKITQALFKSYEFGCENDMLKIIAVLYSGQWKKRPRG